MVRVKQFLWLSIRSLPFPSVVTYSKCRPNCFTTCRSVRSMMTSSSVVGHVLIAPVMRVHDVYLVLCWIVRLSHRKYNRVHIQWVAAPSSTSKIYAHFHYFRYYASNYLKGPNLEKFSIKCNSLIFDSRLPFYDISFHSEQWISYMEVLFHCDFC